jgi:hypothetical protein
MAIENPHDPMVAPAVERLLGRLRRGIRRYIWLEGCAAAVAWLGTAFWITLASDWFFEPSVIVRIAMLATVAAVFVVVVGRMIARRAFVHITDSNVATVLERRFPHLNDSLLTAVILSGADIPVCPGDAVTRGRQECLPHQVSDANAGPEAVNLHREMLTQTCREAESRIEQVELRRVFNPRPLWLHCSAATLLSISVAFFAVLFWGEFGVWARRTLAMSNELWPRNTRLEVVGFDAGVPKKVARGSDLEVVVRADATMPRVPEVVEIRYRTEGGGRGRATMDRRGIARGPADRFQEYTYTFRSILADVQFEVVGGDDRVGGCRIQAVDSPTISRMMLECELPAYIGRKQPPLPVTGVMQIPTGSQVTVRADQANKDIVGVRVNSVVGDRPGPARSLRRDELADDGRGFSYSLPPLTADTTLLFTLTDADGIESREPVRLMLVPTPDQSPQMGVRLDGIGTAITAQARVAVAGRIADDYGIGRVWFERAIDQQEPKTRMIVEPPDAPEVYNLVDEALEVNDFGLKAGQKLLVCVKAADLCDLDRGSNVSQSERWLLDVVTPEQLRAILEARELVLRQRFEQSLQEMTETRDLLSRMRFESGGGEPVDTPERRRDLRFLRVQGALTNCRKGAPEVASIAESFDDICKQLVNNRIDTRELNERLKGRIAEPLHQIADNMFPDLDRRLEKLLSALEDPRRAPVLRDAAQRQAEEILLAMRKVRDSMIELEDFNEAVELLRNIVEMQKKLHDETEQRHKEKIRSLLKE